MNLHIGFHNRHVVLLSMFADFNVTLYAYRKMEDFGWQL